jgi:hypothetical protein
MRRREFITLIGSVAGVWPFVAHAQQQTMPVIGFLDSRSSDAMADRLTAFRIGLKDMGYVEGENVIIAYRWAENHVSNNWLPCCDCSQPFLALTCDEAHCVSWQYGYVFAYAGI